MGFGNKSQLSLEQNKYRDKKLNLPSHSHTIQNPNNCSFCPLNFDGKTNTEFKLHVYFPMAKESHVNNFNIKMIISKRSLYKHKQLTRLSTLKS